MASAYTRLVRKLTTENLWLYVLRLLKDGPLYGYEVKDRIATKFGFKPSMVTCYIILHKLEKEGLISSKRISGKGRGPPRRYYTMTRKGLETLERAKRFLENLSTTL